MYINEEEIVDFAASQSLDQEFWGRVIAICKEECMVTEKHLGGRETEEIPFMWFLMKAIDQARQDAMEAGT